jgi:hypothetical protein
VVSDFCKYVNLPETIVLLKNTRNFHRFQNIGLNLSLVEAKTAELPSNMIRRYFSNV